MPFFDWLFGSHDEPKDDRSDDEHDPGTCTHGVSMARRCKECDKEYDERDRANSDWYDEGYGASHLYYDDWD